MCLSHHCPLDRAKYKYSMKKKGSRLACNATVGGHQHQCCYEGYNSTIKAVSSGGIHRQRGLCPHLMTHFHRHTLLRQENVNVSSCSLALMESQNVIGGNKCIFFALLFSLPNVRSAFIRLTKRACHICFRLCLDALSEWKYSHNMNYETVWE